MITVAPSTSKIKSSLCHFQVQMVRNLTKDVYKKIQACVCPWTAEMDFLSTSENSLIVTSPPHASPIHSVQRRTIITMTVLRIWPQVHSIWIQHAKNVTPKIRAHGICPGTVSVDVLRPGIITKIIMLILLTNVYQVSQIKTAVMQCIYSKSLL